MKRILTLVLLLSAGLTVLGQRNSDPGNSGNKNQNNQNLSITPGASGVKRSIGYRFSSDIADTDPGSGSFRYNRDTVSKVSWMLVDDIDVSGEDQTKWYSTWDKTTGASGRGRITLVEKDGKNTDVFDVSGVFLKASGYWKIPVEYVSGRLPAGGAVYYYIFERIENKKDKTSDPAPEPVIPAAVIPVTPSPPTEPVVPQPAPQPEPTPVQPSPQPQPASPSPVPTPDPASPSTVVTPAPQPEPAPALPEPSPVQPVAAPSPEPVAPLAVVTPAPVTPAPVTPGPVTPAPVTPVPVTPGPITPAPVTPAPVTSAPVTPASVTPAPAPAMPEPQPEPAIVQTAPVSQPAPAPVQTAPASQPAPVPVQPAQNRRIAPDQNNRTPQDETAVTRTTRTSTTTRTPQTAPAVPATSSGSGSNRTAGSSAAASTTVPSQPAPTQQQPSQDPQQPVAVTKPASAPRSTAPATKPSQGTVTNQPPAPATTPANQPPAGPQYTTSSWVSQSAASAPPESSAASLPTYQNPYGSGRSRGKWYHGIIETGYGLGVGEYGISNFRFNFINGIHITPTFSAGLGIGYRYYFTERYADRDLISGKVQFPVFLDLRKIFSTRKVTPYLAFGIGNAARYSAATDSTDAVKEGLLLNPSCGIWFNLSPRFAVFTGVAYEVQKMEYARYSDNGHYKKNTSSVSLNIGISF